MTEVQKLAKIKVLKDMHKEYGLLAKYNGGTDYDRWKALEIAIKALKQEPEKGRWIVAEEFGFGNICECSKCKESVWIYKNTNTWNYCPNCGLKMEGKNETTK